MGKGGKWHWLACVMIVETGAHRKEVTRHSKEKEMIGIGRGGREQ